MNDGLNLIRCISFPDLPHEANLAQCSPATYLSQSSSASVNIGGRRNNPLRGVEDIRGRDTASPRALAVVG